MTDKPHYNWWSEIPTDAGLATKTQLQRDGMKPGGEHVATVSYGRRGQEIALLYLRSQAVPKRPCSPKQQAALAAAREARESRIAEAFQAACEAAEKRDLEREEQFYDDAHEHRQKILQEVVSFAERFPRESWRIVDSETTDLDGEVISIGIVDGHGQILLESLIWPTTPHIHPDAAQVHRLTLEDLQGQPTFAKVHPQIQQTLQGGVMLAYNASFDFSRLQTSHRRAGLPQDQLLQGEAFEAHWHCLMEWAAALYSFPRGRKGHFEGYQWMKLNQACWTAAFKNGQAPTEYPSHQATTDALASLELLNHMLEYAQREVQGLPHPNMPFESTDEEMKAQGLEAWVGLPYLGELNVRELAGQGSVLMGWNVNCNFWWFVRGLKDHFRISVADIQQWWHHVMSLARNHKPEEMPEFTWTTPDGTLCFVLNWRKKYPLMEAQRVEHSKQ